MHIKNIEKMRFLFSSIPRKPLYKENDKRNNEKQRIPSKRMAVKS